MYRLLGSGFRFTHPTAGDMLRYSHAGPAGTGPGMRGGYGGANMDGRGGPSYIPNQVSLNGLLGMRRPQLPPGGLGGLMPRVPSQIPRANWAFMQAAMQPQQAAPMPRKIQVGQNTLTPRQLQLLRRRGISPRGAAARSGDYR